MTNFHSQMVRFHCWTISIIADEDAVTPPPETPNAGPPETTEAPPTETPPTTPTTEAPPTSKSEFGESDNSSLLDAEKEDVKANTYSKRSNLLKIVVPVLVCVALILVISAIVVGLSFCFCERNRRYSIIM